MHNDELIKKAQSITDILEDELYRVANSNEPRINVSDHVYYLLYDHLDHFVKTEQIGQYYIESVKVDPDRIITSYVVFTFPYSLQAIHCKLTSIRSTDTSPTFTEEKDKIKDSRFDFIYEELDE